MPAWSFCWMRAVNPKGKSTSTFLNSIHKEKSARASERTPITSRKRLLIALKKRVKTVSYSKNKNLLIQPNNPVHPPPIIRNGGTSSGSPTCQNTPSTRRSLFSRLYSVHQRSEGQPTATTVRLTGRRNLWLALSTQLTLSKFSIVGT